MYNTALPRPDPIVLDRLVDIRRRSLQEPDDPIRALPAAGAKVRVRGDGVSRAGG
jgi:hypothetical protein